jgi:hypothetical protein
LRESIAATYQDADNRDDVEAFENLDDDLALPKDGMQVRREYTMYGHFFFLRRLLDNTEKIRFFLDQDSAFRAACLSAFSDRIKGDDATLFTCGSTPRRPLTKSARFWQTIDAIWRQ